MSKTGYIYKIVSTDINIKECYVGSTTNFRTRKNGHKTKCNNENGDNYNFYVYQFIRDNGGWNSWSMIQIEEFKFNTRNELNSRERYWIEQLQATLNKLTPSRTPEERYENNKDKRKERYELNKDKRKVYNIKNKDRIKDSRKVYNIKNKDKIKDKRKERYEKNIKFYNEYLEYLQS